LTGLVILIGAAEFAQKGCDLFSQNNSNDEEEEMWTSLCAEPHFEMFMSFYRWKEFCHFSPSMFADDARKEVIPGINFWALLTNSMRFVNQS